MRARLIVFPIRGRNWCFSRSIDPNNAHSSSSSQTPTTLKQLWQKISSSSSAAKTADKSSSDSNVEVVVDFVSDKMNRAWSALEKAPDGSFKSKLHGLGLRLLSRVKPSEVFLKSIPKDVTHVEITYPSSLNARLVRRRLRHIAFRGTVIHKKYFYGSATLLPVTAAFAVLPLPNIPFFWILFRTYSHWRALKGSEKLLQIVSDSSVQPKSSEDRVDDSKSSPDDSEKRNNNSLGSPWVFQPSEELQKLIQSEDVNDGLSKSTVEDISRRFNLNAMDVMKYRDRM